MAEPKETFLRRWFPHPILTAILTIIWMLLLNSFSVGGLVMGFLLGTIIPRMTRSLWAERPRVRHYGKAFTYLLIVVWDIIVANVQVARLILFRPIDRLDSRWVVVPLELTSPEAITVFAGTITMTPGTVSCELSADGRSLLVHCLDAPDPDAAVRQMKSRYEARLKEIFA